MSNTEALYKEHRKNKQLFQGQFREEWVHGDMKEILDAFQTGGSDDSIDASKSLHYPLKEEAKEVYSFNAFAPSFVDMFNEEILHFYETSENCNIPVRRPNSMNNYGVIVNEIGMRPVLTDFQQRYLWPIARRLFPKQGSRFSDHHSFIVRYNANEDLGLDMHVDDSDVTFNVCLGNEFTGATLQFCGDFGSPDHRKSTHTYHHKVGRAVLHLGSRRHGADNIESGTRANLIIWNRNHDWRASEEYRQRRTILYQPESGPPDKICLSYTHDRDYQVFKELPPAARKQVLRPWCPPPGYEYEGFTTTPKSKNAKEEHEL